MNKNSFLFAIGGLVVGLLIGFFAANNLNDSAGMGGDDRRLTKDASIAGQEIQNIVVRDQPTRSGAMPQITETLERAENEPSNFDAQLAAGDLYLKIQNFPKAIEYYEAAEKLKPEDYGTKVKLGNAYFDSQQFEKAGVWYENALVSKPDDFAVRTDLGVSYLERANPDFARAITEFQTSLQTNPNHVPTLYNLAQAYFKSGKIEQAKISAARLQEIDPNSELSLRINKLLE